MDRLELTSFLSIGCWTPEALGGSRRLYDSEGQDSSGSIPLLYSFLTEDTVMSNLHHKTDGNPESVS